VSLLEPTSFFWILNHRFNFFFQPYATGLCNQNYHGNARSMEKADYE
jgi:hypothetical protein